MCKLQPSVGRLQLSLSRRRRAAKRQDAAHLSIAAKSEKRPKTKAGFGSTPTTTTFGTYGRRMVRNACGSLERQFGTRVVFGTVTLPGSTQQARIAISRWSGKLVELLCHWLRSKSKTAQFVWVYENQKNGALHLHFALGDSDILKLRFFERNFKSYVHRMFETLSRLSGTDMFARATGGSWRGCAAVLRSRIETVRKSVKRYMAKYISKGSAVGEPAYCPSRWWGMSEVLRSAVYRFRLSTYLTHSNLELLSAVQSQVEQAALQAKLILFAFSAPYSPHTRTLLIYPPDDISYDVYEALQLVVKHYASTYGTDSRYSGWIRWRKESRK